MNSIFSHTPSSAPSHLKSPLRDETPLDSHQSDLDAVVRSQLEWERTFDSVPDLIAILDTKHRIVRMNKALTERLGKTEKTWIGNVCFQCIHGTLEPPKSCPHLLTMGDGREHLSEVHEDRLGGDFLVSTTPLFDSSGRLIGSVHVARDITQQKQTEKALREAKEQLARANEALEQKVQERTAKLEEMVAELEALSYSMAHDMRGPLRAMEGMASALLEDHADRLDAEGKDFLQRIKAAALRQDQFVRDVLNYSQVARRKIELCRVDLDQLARSVIEQYPNLGNNADRIEIVRPLGCVLGHDLSLAQCVSNLLDNALKFVRPGVAPKIRVWTERRTGFARLWVEDNGLGIALEDQERVFRIFERLHTQEHSEGTGIGLAVVKKAAERMGGRFGVQSAPGEGSRFWIELRDPPE